MHDDMVTDLTVIMEEMFDETFVCTVQDRAP
jgi:hypothetical protein